MNINLQDTQTHPKIVGYQRKLLRHLSGDDYTMEMDWSSLESFLACDRMDLWKLIYSRTTYPGPALTYGSAIHAALEHHYRNNAPYDELLAIGERVFMDSPPPVGEWRTFDTFRNAIQKYLAHYAQEPFRIFMLGETPAVEIPFRLPLTTIEVNDTLAFSSRLLVFDSEDDAPLRVARIHVIWTGIIDLIVEQDEKLWIVDHKTSSVVGDSYFKGFELSQQFLGYVRCGQELISRPIHGALANVIAGRKPTKTGTPLEFLRRYYYYRPEQVTEWQDSITSILENLAHQLVTGAFPMRTNSCTNKFGTCPYHDVCSMPADSRQTILQSEAYAPNVWNPLD